MGIGIKDLVAGALKPAADAFKARQERKAAEKTLEAKIAEKQIDTTAQVQFNEQEWELLALWAGESTWKDEYVTVSVVAIWNFIIIGGIAAAFGYPQILDGIVKAITTLNAVLENPQTGEMTTLGLIMVTTIFAALGIYGVNKLRSR